VQTYVDGWLPRRRTSSPRTGPTTTAEQRCHCKRRGTSLSGLLCSGWSLCSTSIPVCCLSTN
jgi:hypothetical protein